MLTTNVLCLKKKRKKKSYYVANVSQYGGKAAIDKRSPGSTVTMMHITEDTPPDMLAGAMDLTVHLPTGRSVKLSVERSTPMMDLLVQITTTHNLQLSGHILQAMDMTRSGGIGDGVLPYKPNTPIGALDTQHIKVVPKNKAASSFPKTSSLGHQPFESTFRLKVHLPRNQLYVTRVSQNVYLEEIVKKVCEEKGLDPAKYELRHPGNLDEVLDSNLTLSDYQITEIYVVGKGSGTLTQTFSSSDIMALRKEEERKQFQAKTGGGVFNLIFKRSKAAAPEPLPTVIDNRSIPPIENSKSLPTVKEQQPQDRPKPPLRKRRPAPKPPTIQAPVETRNPAIEPNPHVSSTSTPKAENGLIICHSRNSSDSSGYHEASVLSENCNTSLPRRPKSIYDENGNRSRLNGEHSRSTGNLEKMQNQSKSMSSLAAPARKKKAAPPPPKTIQKSEMDKVENASPLVASQPIETIPVSSLGRSASLSINPPLPAPRKVKPPSKASSMIIENERSVPITFIGENANNGNSEKIKPTQNNNGDTLSGTSANKKDIETESEKQEETVTQKKMLDQELTFGENSLIEPTVNFDQSFLKEPINQALNKTTITQLELDTASMDMQLDDQDTQSIGTEAKFAIKDDDSYYSGESMRKSISMDSLHSDFSATSINSKGSKPEIVGVIPKKRKSTNFDTLTRTRGFQIGTSLINMETEPDEISLTTTSDDNNFSGQPSVSSRLSDVDASNEFELHVKEEIFEISAVKKTESPEKKRNEMIEIHTIDEDIRSMNKTRSVSSLRSVDSIPGFIKKWNNNLDLDNISNISDDSMRFRNQKWILGDNSDTESIITNVTTNNTPPESPVVIPSQQQNGTDPIITPPEDIKQSQDTIESKPTELEHKNESSDLDNKNEVDSGICENNISDVVEKEDVIEKDVVDDKDNAEKDTVDKDETDWQYQLPSPPKGFRDASPSLRTCDSTTSCETETVSDSVVTSPELFEKLRQVHDIQSIASDLPSVVSQEEIYEEKDICNKLTLENLEKRKSLVYNRELATSLKYAQSETHSDKRSTKSDVMLELEEVISNDKTSTLLKSNTNKPLIETKHDKHLPNFKISTYDTKKDKINIFEDETVRSNENFHKTTTLPINLPSAVEKNSEINQAPIVQENSGDHPEEGLNRSESFSGPRLPLNPVRRSKSQVALNKYKEVKQRINTESVSRSNSLLDVSGLQSLEVMRIIQNKLSNSKDTINKIGQSEKKHIQEQLETPLQEQIDKKPAKEPIPGNSTNNFTTKRQHFQSPPCIELGSWSQRPKTEITLKEDTDYKLGTGTLKSTPNGVYLNTSTGFNKKPNSTNIKIGKPDHVVTTQTHGSVVISINNDQKEPERVVNQFRNDIFKKPFEKGRPHSIAFDNHVPIVRSVELKKQFQDLPSKSITEITNNVIHFDNQPKSLSYVNLFSNNNSISNSNHDKPIRKDPITRPVMRNNSFTPVVKGFRTPSSETDKKVWDTYRTLPSNKNFTTHDLNTNKNVPFSQVNLRRTESTTQTVNGHNNNKNIFGNVVLRNNSNNARLIKPEHRHSTSVIMPPPPPPVLPTLKPVKKITNTASSSADARDQLLQAIRNFGGKKGLKATKS